MTFPYDLRTPEEKARDEHWYAYLDGELDGCTCDLCYEWDKQTKEDICQKQSK